MIDACNLGKVVLVGSISGEWQLLAGTRFEIDDGGTK